MLQLAYIVSHGNPVAVPGAAVQVGSHHKQPPAFPESVGSMLSSFRFTIDANYAKFHNILVQESDSCWEPEVTCARPKNSFVCLAILAQSVDERKTISARDMI